MELNIQTRKKKNKKGILFVIILLLLCILGYFIYKEFLNSKEDIEQESTQDTDMGEEIVVSVIATGLSQIKDFDFDNIKINPTIQKDDNFEDSDLETFKQAITQEMNLRGKKSKTQQNIDMQLTKEETDIFSGLSLLEDDE